MYYDKVYMFRKHENGKIELPGCSENNEAIFFMMAIQHSAVKDSIITPYVSIASKDKSIASKDKKVKCKLEYVWVIDNNVQGRPALIKIHKKVIIENNILLTFHIINTAGIKLENTFLIGKFLKGAENLDLREIFFTFTTKEKYDERNRRK